MTLSSCRGSVVLLSFWSAKCPSCLADISSLKKLGSIVDSVLFRIITVHAGAPAKTEEGLVVVNDTDLKITLSGYRITSLPTVLLIDKTGKIMKIYRGQQDWTDSKKVQEIKAALAVPDK